MGFFKPAWQSKNKEKAFQAVLKETDQVKLAEIAKNAPLFVVGIKAVEKISDQAILIEIANGVLHKEVSQVAITKLVSVVKGETDQAKLFDISNTSPLEVRQAAEKQAQNIALKKMKQLTQEELLAIWLGENKCYYGWWWKEEKYDYLDKCKQAAYEFLIDKKLLIQFAQTSGCFKQCVKAYQKLGVLSEDCTFRDIMNLNDSPNKDDLLKYAATNLGSTVGRFSITKDDVETLFMQNKTELLRVIAGTFRAPFGGLACERLGGHFFNNYCICTVCGLQEHDFDYDIKKLPFPWVGDICRRCGGRIEENNFSYYDGVPGYGETVSSSSRYVIYPDGAKDDSHVRYHEHRTE